MFEEKFPRQARNEIKARLHIKNIVFHVRGEMYDEYGDEYIVNAEFAADTSGKIIRKPFDENETVITEQSVDIGVSTARKLFNVAVHNYDISFWDEDLCHNDSYDPDVDFLDDEFDFDDDEPREDEPEQTDDNDGAEVKNRIPDWSVEIKYKNGTEQNIKDYDCIPYPVMELFDHFDSFFEDEESNEDFDD